MIEHDIVGFGGPPWFEQDITLPDAPDEPLTMYLRHIGDCADYLLGRPDLAGDVEFQPRVIFKPDDKTQVFSEMFTAHLWHILLVRVKRESRVEYIAEFDKQKLAGQDPDAAMGGVMLGSDVTHLTHYSGDVKVHGVYVSLGNIHKDVRNHTSRRAWMLVAYIPICKWETTMAKTTFRSKQHENLLPGILNRRLFHYCMEILCEPLRELEVHEIIDSEGNVRLIFYVLIAYLADLEEQYKIAALDKSNCIHCKATTVKFGSPDPCETRVSDSILEDIEKVQNARGGECADAYEFALGCDKHRLGDVEYPFWKSLPLVDICKALSVDLLHGFHKFFYDHPFQWNLNSLGKDELDARMKSQVALVGGRVFPRGVSHISQMSGKEHRALQTVHLGVVANAPIQYSREITLATRALLDFIYLAQLPSHTDDTLSMFEAAYDKFHKYKNVWIKNGGRQGEKGNVIEHFNIPKLHTARHLAEQVRDKGTADNYSTEVVEHLHIDTLKEPYKATNRKEWKRQTVRYLVRRDKLLDFSLWLGWASKAQVEGVEEEVGNDQDTEGKLAVVQPLHWIGELANVFTLSGGGTMAQPAGPQSLYHRNDLSTQVRTSNALDIPFPFALSHLAPGHWLGAFSNPQALQASTSQRSKKRKRKPDDEREERSAKRIHLSQQTYGLLAHQDLALRPATKMTVAKLQETFQQYNFLSEYQSSTYQASNPMDENTVVETWQSMRLIESQRRFHPKPKWRRVQAVQPTKTEIAVSDPVLYTKEQLGEGSNVGAVGLHGDYDMIKCVHKP